MILRRFGFSVFSNLGFALHKLARGEGAVDIANDKLDDAIENEEGDEADATTAVKQDESSDRSTTQVVMTKLKIVIAAYQIACSIPWTLPQVKFPAIFKKALELGSAVNLSFISFAKTECFGAFSYFDKLVFVTLTPVVVVFVIAAVCAMRYACVDQSRRSKVLEGGAYWILFALYCLIPSTSAYCFRYFSCATYVGYDDDEGLYDLPDDGDKTIKVLRIDPMISCTSPSYDNWLPYVVISIVVYPIGVPLGFAIVLWRQREHLNPSVSARAIHRTPSGRNIVDRRQELTNEQDEDYLDQAVEHYNESLVQLRKLEARADDPALASITFLYEEFEPRCSLFVVFEVSRRIFLTGCLTMFLPGTISQIAVGLLGSMISYRVFSHYDPYVEDDDDLVSEVAQTQ